MLTRCSNAHIHLPPNFSAFTSTTQALDQAQNEQVAALGVSNYYDFSIYADFAEKARRRGIFPLFGVETICLLPALAENGIKINDPGNPGKMYLCGKGISDLELQDPAARLLLGEIRENDARRIAAMTELLSSRFADAGLDAVLTADAIKADIARRYGISPSAVYLQERHLGQAFQEMVFAQTKGLARDDILLRVFGRPSKDAQDAAVVQDEIRSLLLKAGRPAYVADSYVGFDHVYNLILALGGIPSYPVLADGANPICGYEEDVSHLAAALLTAEIHAAELIPIRNTAAATESYARTLRDAGIIVTAGTEHNTLDCIPLVPTSANRTPISDEIREIFWEGTCVVAAHQAMRSRGQTGYVDTKGNLNPAYGTTEDRIAAFRGIGEDAIAALEAQSVPSR